MGQSKIHLIFPFRINGTEHKAEIESPLIRKENVVTLSLPLFGLVTVASSKRYTVHYTSLSEKTKRGVSIEFKDINDAISFEKEPEIHLSYEAESKLLSIDEELRRVTHQLEETKEYWKKRKRSSVYDDDDYQIA